MNDIQFFDNLEARFQDEKGYEPFEDYVSACKARFGARFISLIAEPFVLKITGETFEIKDGQILHTQGE